jgi:hypothetical protein
VSPAVRHFAFCSPIETQTRTLSLSKASTWIEFLRVCGTVGSLDGASRLVLLSISTVYLCGRLLDGRTTSPALVMSLHMQCISSSSVPIKHMKSAYRSEGRLDHVTAKAKHVQQVKERSSYFAYTLVVDSMALDGVVCTYARQAQ